MLILGPRTNDKLFHIDVFMLLFGITNGDGGLGFTPAGEIITYERTLDNIGARLVDEIVNSTFIVSIEAMTFGQSFPPMFLSDGTTVKIDGTIESNGGGLTFGPIEILTVFFDISNANGTGYFSSGIPTRNPDNTRNNVCAPSHVLLFHELVHAAESIKTGSFSTDLELFVRNQENLYRKERGLPLRDESGNDDPDPNFPGIPGPCDETTTSTGTSSTSTGTSTPHVCFVTEIAKGRPTTIHGLRDLLLDGSPAFGYAYGEVRRHYSSYSPIIAADLGKDDQFRHAMCKWLVEPLETAISIALPIFPTDIDVGAARLRAPSALAALRGDAGDASEIAEARTIFQYIERVTREARAECAIHRWLWAGRELLWVFIQTEDFSILHRWLGEMPLQFISANVALPLGDALSVIHAQLRKGPDFR